MGLNSGEAKVPGVGQELARALTAEIITLLEPYKEVMGPAIEQWKPGKFLALGGSIWVANFFPVYDGNTAKLGSFDESDAVVIVRTRLRNLTFNQSTWSSER